MRVISFCADGIRQAAKRGFYDWVLQQDADVICIQDLRAQEYDLTESVFFPAEYNAYFFDAVEPNRNGVAIYVKKLPKAIMTGLGFADFDMDGLYIQADYDKVSIGSLLVPSYAPGDDRARLRQRQFFEQYQNHLNKVRNKRRQFIVCGNWQTAHQSRDMQQADRHLSSPGFQPEEQQWMDQLLGPMGYIDAFRQINSDADEFTWWPNDQADDGWRVDYQVVSNGLKEAVEYGSIYKGERFSSHAPVIMDYDIEL